MARRTRQNKKRNMRKSRKNRVRKQRGGLFSSELDLNTIYKQGQNVLGEYLKTTAAVESDESNRTLSSPTTYEFEFINITDLTNVTVASPEEYENKKIENEILSSITPILDKVYSNKVLTAKNFKKDDFLNKKVELSLCDNTKVTGVVSHVRIGKAENKLYSLSIGKEDEYTFVPTSNLSCDAQKKFHSLKFIKTASP